MYYPPQLGGPKGPADTYTIMYIYIYVYIYIYIYISAGPLWATRLRRMVHVVRTFDVYNLVLCLIVYYLQSYC